MRMKFPVSALALVFLAASAVGQIVVPDPVLSDPTSETSLAALRRATESQPGALQWQRLGTALILAGRPLAAIEALDAALKLESAAFATSGFEALATKGTKLASTVAKIKPAVALEGGRAAALNNRGVARLMLGEPQAALADFDEAAVLGEGWTPPWINGALASIALNRLAQADANAAEVARRGDASPRALAVRAEVALLLQRFQSARELIDQIELADPRYPYGLLIRARLLEATGDARESERALTQALLYGPLVASESKLEPSSGEGYGFVGGAGAVHGRLSHHAVSRNLDVARIFARTDRLQVEGRESAYQSRDLFEGVYSSRQLGAFYGLYRQSGGGRPGSEEPIAGVVSNPEARFRFNNSLALWVHSFDLGGGGLLTALAKFRESRLDDRASDGADWIKAIHDRSFGGELRYTRDMPSNRAIVAGFSYTRLDRSGNGNAPFDPAESIMPLGKSDIWTGYGAYEMRIGPRLNATLGVVGGNTDTATVLEPLAEIRFGTSRPIRLGIRPRLNDANSNLIPSGFLSGSPQKNPIDRHSHQPQDFNNDPVLFGRNSRAVDTELSVPVWENLRSKADLVLFHREMENVRLPSADPRVATKLRTTLVSDGRADGLEMRYLHRIRPGLGLTLVAAYQQTSGAPSTPTFDLDQFPAKVPASSNRLANFPAFQAVSELEWSLKQTSLTLTGAYIGARPRTITVDDAVDGQVTFVGDARAAFGLHFFARHRISDRAQLQAGIFNLTRARFYEGYPAATTGFFGWEYRY